MASPSAAVTILCQNDCSELDAITGSAGGTPFDFEIGLRAVTEGVGIKIITEGNIYVVSPIHATGRVDLFAFGIVLGDPGTSGEGGIFTPPRDIDLSITLSSREGIIKVPTFDLPIVGPDIPVIDGGAGLSLGSSGEIVAAITTVPANRPQSHLQPSYDRRCLSRHLRGDAFATSAEGGRDDLCVGWRFIAARSGA
jgi:hypothetical protein